MWCVTQVSLKAFGMSPTFVTMPDVETFLMYDARQQTDVEKNPDLILQRSSEYICEGQLMSSTSVTKHSGAALHIRLHL